MASLFSKIVPVLTVLALHGCFGADAEDRDLVDYTGGASAAPPGGAGAGGASMGGASSTQGGASQGGASGTGGSQATNAGSSGSTGVLLPSNCVDPWTEIGKYHADGYDDSAIHGNDAKLQRERCQSCHGDTLAGCAKAPSCDNCHDGGHPNGWRTNCTYCHGGVDGDSGAPPRDIDGVTDATLLSFRGHKAHVTAQRHAPFDCTECHTKPTDALSPGHMFDSTPGRAEVTFNKGLSKSGSYDGNGGCSNIYCHGTGKKTGSSKHTDTNLTCRTCHGNGRGMGLGGDHDLHLAEGLSCGDCHRPVSGTATTLASVNEHVNGKIELKMDTPFTAGTCTGACHNEFHTAEAW